MYFPILTCELSVGNDRDNSSTPNVNVELPYLRHQNLACDRLLHLLMLVLVEGASWLHPTQCHVIFDISQFLFQGVVYFFSRSKFTFQVYNCFLFEESFDKIVKIFVFMNTKSV